MVAPIAIVSVDVIAILSISTGAMTIAVAICDAVVDEGAILILTELAHKFRFQS